jgi:UDP:flavonoid glycosyltransferase YjiC (YdhE family)
MARIVITTFGTAGDINPFLALGLGLRKRGDDVLFAVEDVLRPVVEAAGFPAHHLTGDAMSMLGAQMRALLGKSSPLRALRVVVEAYLVPTLRPRIRELLLACDHADLLVASSPQVAAAFAADLLHIPLVTVPLSPIAIPSAYTSLQPLPVRLPPSVQRLVNRAFWALGGQVVGRIVDPPLNQVRREYGLRPYRNWMAVGRDNTSAQLVAVAVSPSLSPPPPDWPPVARETGFLFWDELGNWRAPAELSSFLSDAAPIVALSAGSMSLDMPGAFGSFYRDGVAAIRAAGARSLLVGATDEALPDPLPPDVYALPYAPFSVIYPRCAAVIHHGGIGTAAQALRAGVPQLVVPWVLDQFWAAAQVERIGAGHALQGQRFSAVRATPLVRDLLSSDRIHERCAGVAAKIAREDGVATLCDAIGEIVDSRNKVVDNHRT